MSSELKIADPSQAALEAVCEHGGGPSTLDQITEELHRVIAEVASNGEKGLQLHLKTGELLCRAKKEKKKRGEFGPWCENVLGRSPSFCSSRMRLYKNRENLEPAREWAKGKKHRYKDCQSPERILILVADWMREVKGGDGARQAQHKPKVSIAELKKQLEENEREFVALRDPLNAGDIAEAKRLALVDDEASKAALRALARQRHWRVRDLIACALQLSDPATVAVLSDV